MEHHPWSDSEADSGGCDHRHAWSSDSGLSGSSDSEFEGIRDPTPAELLIDEMTELHLTRALTARSFCVVMYYAGLCGVPGCSELGKPPDLPSGHYHRHLSKHLPMYRDGAVEYEIQMPCSTKGNPGRDSTWHPVLVPQEELDNELRTTPGWADKVKDAIDNGLFPPCYDTNPIVQASTAPVVPVAVFVDAVPYSNVDSLIGFWVLNVLTGVRHLIVSVRKA